MYNPHSLPQSSVTYGKDGKAVARRFGDLSVRVGKNALGASKHVLNLKKRTIKNKAAKQKALDSFDSKGQQKNLKNK